jgi:hypothetical protein
MDSMPETVYTNLMKIMDKEWPALEEHITDPEILEVAQVYLDAMTQRKDACWKLLSYYTPISHQIPYYYENNAKERDHLRNSISHIQATEDEQIRRLTKLLHYREMDYDTLLSKGFIRYKY